MRCENVFAAKHTYGTHSHKHTHTRSTQEIKQKHWTPNLSSRDDRKIIRGTATTADTCINVFMFRDAVDSLLHIFVAIAMLLCFNCTKQHTKWIFKSFCIVAFSRTPPNILTISFSKYIVAFLSIPKWFHLYFHWFAACWISESADRCRHKHVSTLYVAGRYFFLFLHFFVVVFTASSFCSTKAYGSLCSTLTHTHTHSLEGNNNK